jgi:hypothetical protein
MGQVDVSLYKFGGASRKSVVLVRRTVQKGGLWTIRKSGGCFFAQQAKFN